MMKSRKLAIGLLLMLSIAVTTGSFAFWANGFAGNTAVNSAVTVTIGQGTEQSSTLSLTAFTANTGAALIPTTRLVNAGN